MRWLANILVSRSRREKLLAKTMAGVTVFEAGFSTLEEKW